MNILKQFQNPQFVQVSTTLNESTLWSNPGSSTSKFARQTVDLTSGVSNFKYIKFTYYIGTTNSKIREVIYSISEFKNSNRVSIGFIGNDSKSYRRGAEYVTDTSIKFDSAVIDTTTTYNCYIIPERIIGLR